MWIRGGVEKRGCRKSIEGIRDRRLKVRVGEMGTGGGERREHVRNKGEILIWIFLKSCPNKRDKMGHAELKNVAGKGA